MVPLKAVYVEEPFRIGIREIDKPRISENEVLIKVKCTGICGSDHHAYKGLHAFRKPPVILGHELSGVIVEVGSLVTRFKEGDRVTVMPQVGCGKCKLCREGHPNICTTKRVPGMGGWLGSFVEYFNSPEDIVVKLPDNVDYAEGALAEPLAVAIHVLKSVSKDSRNNLVILGSGTIGLLMVAAAPAFGFKKVLTTDALDYNLKMAEEFGAVKTVNVLKDQLADAIRGAFNGEKADAVVIAAGAPDILDQAIESVRPKGEIIYLAMITKPITINSYPIVFRELNLKGSQTYTMEDFVDAVDIIASGKIDFTKFITHKYNIDDAQEAMEMVDKKYEDSVKVMLCI